MTRFTHSTITVMLALAASVLMSACVQHHVPPRAEPGPPHKGGNFCPPGQAKKGNC